MLPSSGWVTVPENAPITRFPLPAPIRGVYRDKVGSIDRTDTRSVSYVVRQRGGLSVTARAGYSASGVFLVEATIEMTEAYGVCLLDSLEVPAAGFERCSDRPNTPFTECSARPVAGAWSQG